ncbi:MAG: Fic family protein [Bacilli bacterium]|nr:Fic family protein [Bacilli bacterium]
MSETKIKSILINEMQNKVSNGLYYYSQINFAYNSNRIEGSRLSEEQTKEIFSNSSNNNLIIDDEVIETQNHFKLFDYILEIVDREINVEMILEMHRILKSNTSEKMYAGKFKICENVIGKINSIETVVPSNVLKKVENLIYNYKMIDKVTIEDIIDFHYQFEIVHPFNDGNGRIGRIIMFKECLKNNIIPFIIADENKLFYLRGLKNYKYDKMFLVDACKNAQDMYEQVCNILID